jgi:hypothetical protein
MQSREAVHHDFDSPCDLPEIWTSQGTGDAMQQVTEAGGAEGTRGYLVLRGEDADQFHAASAPEMWRPRKSLDLRDTCVTLYLREIEPISVAEGYEPHLFITSSHPRFGSAGWYLKERLVVGGETWTFNHVHLLTKESLWGNYRQGTTQRLDPYLARVGCIGVMYLKGDSLRGAQATGALGIDEVRYGMEIERPMADLPLAERPPDPARPRSGRAARELTEGPPNGPWRLLLLDDDEIAEQANLRRVYHPALKHPDSPIITRTYPWEGFGPYVHGTVLRDGGRLRMWYFVYSGKYMNAYAESEDGLHWDKPNVGLCEFQGSKQNNLVLSDESEFALGLNLSVIKRPWEADPEKRYMAFFNSLAPQPCHVCFAYSPDGLDWAIDPDGPNELRSGDEMRVFQDPYQNRYVATCKTSKERRGRAVRLAVSDDGIDWQYLNSGQVVFHSEETGKTAHQIYNMPVFAYQGLYIGMPNIYHAGWPDHAGAIKSGELPEAEAGTPATADIEIAWSRDLVNWQRPPGPQRSAFIPVGRSGDFDSAMVMGVANAPVVVGDELWFYYGGWTAPHRSPTRDVAIGLAVLRLDGFASLRAGSREGRLITKPEQFTRPAVLINARVSPGGYLAAELLDERGRPLPGFERDRCLLFTGDSVRHRLMWKKREFPADEARRTFAIRFYMREADLYSFLPR